MSNTVISSDISRIATVLSRSAKKLEGRTLLISGGAGFLGNYIIRVIDEFNRNYFTKPCKVFCIDNYITSTKKKGNRTLKHIKYIEHDVCKPFSIKARIDFIIHAAGIASPIYYKKYPLQAIEVNTQGVKNLLELGVKNKVKSFLYFSTSEVYGDPDPRFIPTPETYRGNVSSIGPRACYDESKRLGEALVVNYYDVYKLRVKIVRPFNVYGPGMKSDDYRVVPAFLYNALQKKPLQVHDSGQQTRTYCYISDATVAFLKVLLNGKAREVYNVGNDAPEISTYDLAQLVVELFKKKIKVKKISYPSNYPQDVPQRRCPDITKIKTKLRYKPRIDLETGLQRTLTWYQEKLFYKETF